MSVVDGQPDTTTSSTRSTSSAAGVIALECRGVSVTFGRDTVLGPIDLSVDRGRWLGLIGPNGAGKTTLLRAMAGLVDHQGRIELGTGVGPAGAAASATEVAVVPQSPVLPPGMTVAEYVLLGRTAHLGWLARESDSDRRIAADVVDRLDLGRFAARFVAELSGGEAQRVVVARALAQQAPILLLDEPTSALDLGHQQEVLELVDQLRRSDGLTVIAAMHDLTTAARFADRLALLDRGQLVADGRPVDVLEAERLSQVYATPLSVRTIDGELVVLAGPRPNRTNAPTDPSS
ncbi:MAG: ABC transporter ATP-binding protein [Actinomycetota bacterium]